MTDVEWNGNENGNEIEQNEMEQMVIAMMLQSNPRSQVL